MAKRMVPANLIEEGCVSGRKVWCHYCKTNRNWKEVCWVGVMENFLDRVEADSFANEISCTKLQCVSCFIKVLSKEDASHIVKEVKTFLNRRRIEHGEARSSAMRTMKMYESAGEVRATPKQSSRSSASTHAPTFVETSDFEPVAIPPDASQRKRKRKHRNVMRIMFREK